MVQQTNFKLFKNCAIPKFHDLNSCTSSSISIWAINWSGKNAVQNLGIYLLEVPSRLGTQSSYLNMKVTKLTMSHHN